MEQIGYPAAYENIIAVGGTGPDDTRYLISDTSGSNYGNEIDLVAPGMFIVHLNKSDNNKFTTYSRGTSLSAAFVTGVASLLLSKNPSLTPEQIRTILQNSADDQVGDPSEDTKGWDKYYGWGRLNAHRALQITSGVRNTRYQLQQFIAARKNVLHVEGIVISPVTRHFTLNGSLVKNKTGAGKVRIAPGFYIYQPADVNRN